MRHAAVFLDKDGTLINNVPYNVDPELIALSDGSGIGLSKLYRAGFQLVVVSNQSGVARGYFPESALVMVEERLRDLLLKEANATLAGFYYCPHYPQGSVEKYAITCECRKPNPGMLIQAAQDLNIDLSQSWLIGDILDDIEAGRRAGCRTILINNGSETEWVITPYREPHFIVENMEDAARTIYSILAAKNDDMSELLVE
jgi:D-glycero-D-manno-heptose 1,7-bisphosphate phosphatase